MEKPKPSINKFKRAILEIYKWYPQYVSDGYLEKEFGKKEGERIIGKLDRDGILDGIASDPEDDKLYYELTPKGVDFAISIINLENTQKIVNLTRSIIILTRVMLVGVSVQIGLLIYSLFT